MTPVQRIILFVARSFAVRKVQKENNIRQMDKLARDSRLPDKLPKSVLVSSLENDWAKKHDNIKCLKRVINRESAESKEQ